MERKALLCLAPGDTLPPYAVSSSTFRRVFGVHCYAALNLGASVEHCPSSMTWRARENVAPLQRNSRGWMPARRLSAGVGCRHPVTSCKAVLMVRSMRRVWALWHHTGAQYYPVEFTRARVAICSVVTPASQPEPASHFRSAKRDVNFLRSDSRCRRCVSDLSSVTPSYLGSEEKGGVSWLWLTFSSRLASLLSKWKTADTVFVVLSFSFQVWKYSCIVAMSLLSNLPLQARSHGGHSGAVPPKFLLFPKFSRSLKNLF